MKIKVLLLAALASLGAAQGAVTLQFSTTSIYVGGFQNGSGDFNGPEARMVWGVIVDGAGDGLDHTTTNYASGFSLASNATGTDLTLVGGAATDDRLYIAGAVMAQNASAIDGAAVGDNRILTFSNLNFGGSAGAADHFYVVWFDVTALGGTAGDGLKYGILDNAIFNLPNDGSTTPFSAPFEGADPSKPMNFFVGVPEPSVALLGVLGVFGFLRRRR
jgi:hypothetical protein